MDRMDTTNRLRGKDNRYSVADIWVPAVLCLYISITNLNGALFALPFVAFCLGYAILMPIQKTVGILLVNMVFLGYSYINLGPSIGISNYGFTHLCYLMVGVRALLGSELLRGKLKLSFVKLPFLLLALYLVLRHLTASLENGIYELAMMMCIWYLLLSCKDDRMKQSLAIQFVTTVLLVFVYYIFQHGIYEPDSSGRFPGVRDANNFALHCNLCIVMWNGFCRDVPGKAKRIVNIILIIGVLITGSVSGVATMLVILAMLFFDKNRKMASGLLVVVAVLIIVLLTVVFVPLEKLAGMGGIVERFVKVAQQLIEGDLQSATTGRYGLWEFYMEEFTSFSPKNKLFGDLSAVNRIMEMTSYASHNAYVDYLLSYGIVGMVLLVINILHRIVTHLVRKEKILLLLNLVIVVNAFFRTLSGIGFWLPILM